MTDCAKDSDCKRNRGEKVTDPEVQNTDLTVQTRKGLIYEENLWCNFMSKQIKTRYILPHQKF